MVDKLPVSDQNVATVESKSAASTYSGTTLLGLCFVHVSRGCQPSGMSYELGTVTSAGEEGGVRAIGAS